MVPPPPGERDAGPRLPGEVERAGAIQRDTIDLPRRLAAGAGAQHQQDPSVHRELERAGHAGGQHVPSALRVGHRRERDDGYRDRDGEADHVRHPVSPPECCTMGLES